MPADRFDVDLGWGRVSALRWGAPPSEAERTVLLLHGGGTDSASLSWGGVGARLAAAGYSVVAPDHPGYGHSPAAPWVATQDRLVTYVGELIDALALGRHAVGGLSLGGGMTVGHVLDRPGGAVGAMLLGSYGIMPRLAAANQLLSWALLRTGVLSALTRSYASSSSRMERGLRGLVRNQRYRTPELVDEVVAATRRDGSLAAFEQWQHDQVAWNRLRTDYTARLDTFPCPALLVHGERDSGVPVARARAAAELIPDARLVLAPGAGHWVQRDDPDHTVAAMTEFLDGLDW